MDVSLRRVVYVELGTLRREGQPIGVVYFFGEQLELTVRGESIHTFERNFLLLVLRQVRGRIGKVNSAIGAEHHVVGAVQAFALVVADDNIVFSAVRREADDGAQNTGTIQKPVLPIVGIAVRVAERDDFLLLT